VKKRGKVLRDARRGKGLLFVEGQQFPFAVPDLWSSEQLPAPGMSVEVEFGSAGEMLAIRPITKNQNGKVEGRTSRTLGRLLASIRRVQQAFRSNVSRKEIRKGLESKSVEFKT
jgi:hypothetical protein